jgi:hypothetical protein
MRPKVEALANEKVRCQSRKFQWHIEQFMMELREDGGDNAHSNRVESP